jgi:hypothetical protein
VNSEITSLHRITQLPFDANTEIFLRQYRAFKLGVSPAVRHYAELLLPVVKTIIANDSKHTGWIFNAPPIVAHTPAAANLLCRELFDLYMRDPETRNAKEVSHIDFHYDNSIVWTDPPKWKDYAKLDFADRVAERERLNQQLGRNTNFQGRSILFINDICVTGAQQQAMQLYFERVEAACVKWLYLLVVDPEIGRKQPDIEWKINFIPFDNLLRMVSSEEIQFTGKCVQRLMGLGIAEFEQVLRALHPERRAQLLEFALLNGCHKQDDFQQQMELLRLFSHR